MRNGRLSIVWHTVLTRVLVAHAEEPAQLANARHLLAGAMILGAMLGGLIAETIVAGIERVAYRVCFRHLEHLIDRALGHMVHVDHDPPLHHLADRESTQLGQATTVLMSPRRLVRSFAWISGVIVANRPDIRRDGFDDFGEFADRAEGGEHRQGHESAAQTAHRNSTPGFSNYGQKGS